MAGIYIHIPFCRQKCYYCDFYKTVNTSLTRQFLSVLKEETKLRKNYLENEAIETVYFGGGTPSVLTAQELSDLLGLFSKEFHIADKAEISLEANPDDLSPEYLSGLKKAGVNRLSLGIQSLQDEHLKKMNRRHNARQAVLAVENAASRGFDNISVDLIYGLPGLTAAEWEHDLKHVFTMPVQHISAYHLTYHEGTPFYTWLKKGTLKELEEKESVAQFNTLVDLCVKNGFEHYEISNFAKNQNYSRHNSAYWLGKKYLGLGPSAHSFDGRSRRWNVSQTEAYIKGIEKNTLYFEEEKLTQNDRYNEYILTRIRTKWGVSASFIRNNFGQDKEAYFLAHLEKYRNTGSVIEKEGIITLTTKGLFISDDIMADLIII